MERERRGRSEEQKGSRGPRRTEETDLQTDFYGVETGGGPEEHPVHSGFERNLRHDRAPRYNYTEDDRSGIRQFGNERDWLMRQQLERGQGRRISYEDWLVVTDNPPNRGGSNKASRNVVNHGAGLSVSRPKNQRNVPRKIKPKKGGHRQARAKKIYEDTEAEKNKVGGES
jgi:hypothetical protein